MNDEGKEWNCGRAVKILQEGAVCTYTVEFSRDTSGPGSPPVKIRYHYNGLARYVREYGQKDSE